MPTYMIEGKRVQTDTPLSDAEIDEIASSIKAPKSETQPSMADQAKRQAGLTARTAITALSSPVTAAADFLASAANVGLNLAGSEKRVPLLSQVQQQGLTAMGLPQPESTVEKVSQGGVGAMLGAAGAAKLLPQTALGQNLVQQIPAAAAAGAVSQPAYDVTKELTGSDIAATIASLGASTVAAGAAGKMAGKMTQPSQPVVTMDEIKQRAQRAYTTMEDAGVSLKNNSARGLIGDMRKALEDANWLPQSKQQSDIGDTLRRFNQIIKDKDVSFTQLEQMRGLATSLKNSNEPNVRRLAGVMTEKIDDFVANIKSSDISTGAGNAEKAIKSVMEARKDWRNLSRATVLDDILNVADAKAINPSASEASIIRQKMIDLLADKNKMRLFSDKEQNAIKAVAKGGPFDLLLSTTARLNPLRSQIAFGSNLYVAGQSPAAAAVMGGAGFAADKLQGAAQRSATRGLMSDILGGTVQEPLPRTSIQGLFSAAVNPPQ